LGGEGVLRAGIEGWLACLRACAGLVFAIALTVFAIGAAAPGLAQSLEQQIDSALKSDKRSTLTRSLTQPLNNGEADRKAAGERRFIDLLRSRSIAIEASDPASAEERVKIIEIAGDKPRIDLEIYFDYDSAAVGPKAVPTLIALGNVLSKPDYAGAIFFINGYTDAKGSAEYNLGLSQRRAAAVRRVLIEQFKLPPDTLIATGFGKEQLKLSDQPFADQNRRVQIVNTEQKAARR
jgi:outer membrane protein OmpA-like peptidoglycan-associated protein